MSLNATSGAGSAALLEAMHLGLADVPAGPIAVALSGGGDSTALTILLQSWCEAVGRTLSAVTVDHGLRSGSEEEALAAKSMCDNLGIEHTTLVWQGWNQRGNLQDAARGARRKLIGSWAIKRGIGAVALGHTLDDQAETFLMRLARGSGVDGLAAMKMQIHDQGILWFRPMLDISRKNLREFLQSQEISWSEDPSNEDNRFDRVRARNSLTTLAALGLDAERLAATAAQMRRAREALEQATLDLARNVATPGPLGDIVLNPSGFVAAPDEIRLRLLAACLNWIASARYRPRLKALNGLNEAIGEGGLKHPFTLHGCTIRNAGGQVSLRREPGRTELPKPLCDTLWDGRWQVTPPRSQSSDQMVGALGEQGLLQWPDWRSSGFDRELLLSSPAIRQGSQLVFAFARDSGVESPLCLKGGSEGFFAAIRTR